MFFSSSIIGSVCDRWMQRGARSFFLLLRLFVTETCISFELKFMWTPMDCMDNMDF